MTPTALAASAFGSVHGIFHSRAFTVTQDVVLLLVVVFWLGLAHWVYRDARRRLDDGLLVATATALGLLVPFVGPVIYMLFRPPETLEDVRARDVEVLALQQRIAPQGERCPVCRTGVERAFLVCPVCTTQLKQPCACCDAPLDRLWQVCPYCATPVVTPVVAAADLDAALTAEVTANGSGRQQLARAARAAGQR